MDSATVLKYFQEITRVPRESGHEGPITEYLQKFAEDHGLACKTDKTGNVVITNVFHRCQSYVTAFQYE